ncbi:hypothetical protein V2I01_34460 [Micromonospora sp. BRA006-A]|nr:hypothetical protein [Micromonospora sp. BRA006-A]
MVTETGAADAAGHKARWIRDTFRALPRYPGLIGLIWFEVTGEGLAHRRLTGGGDRVRRGGGRRALRRHLVAGGAAAYRDLIPARAPCRTVGLPSTIMDERDQFRRAAIEQGVPEDEVAASRS